MFGLVGLSHKTTPIEIRELFSFSGNEITGFLNFLQLEENFIGAVVVSTCNRMEVYYHMNSCCNGSASAIIIKNLLNFKKYNTDLNSFFYIKTGKDAANHLFNVVSGLDSLIIGEDQILCQVKDALKISQKTNSTGKLLSRLFHKAFEAGKRVRTETSISKGNASISSAAVEMCFMHFPDLQTRTVMMIGAGQTGELVVNNLYKKGCKNIMVANRTFSKAEEVAHKNKACAIDFMQVSEFLPVSDVVIVATSSTKPLINNNLAYSSVKRRNNQKQLFIDLSVPRNIEQSISQINGIELLTVDDLEEIVKNTSEKRKEAIVEAQSIINEILIEFMDWLNVKNLSPAIAKIRNNFHDINSTELQGFIKINSIKDTEIIENYAHHITEKYIRALIKNVRTVTENGRRTDYIEFVNELFELKQSNYNKEN